ncbi:hypothetical protein GGI07_002154 [Coemansia sp. Benny D115]|nr:hypothetical protein GGI07_002154 [Coemansia sp. Benny D115]
MFKHFTLESNNIAVLANPSSISFQQLLESLIAHQPNIRDIGEPFKPVLESFVSNQNSRIFCALTDLYNWYKSGMNYTILQLTTKHINSIFKRPPYEIRPYTRELTYAQRLIMIFHVCNPEPWTVLVQAYSALFQAQYNKTWPDSSKFLLSQDCRAAVPKDIYSTIQECITSAFSPKPSPVEHMFNNTSPNIGKVRSFVKHGKVEKRRAQSTNFSSKEARDSILDAVRKQRSTTFAGKSNNRDFQDWNALGLTSSASLFENSTVKETNVPSSCGTDWLNITAESVAAMRSSINTQENNIGDLSAIFSASIDNIAQQSISTLEEYTQSGTMVNSFSTNSVGLGTQSELQQYMQPPAPILQNSLVLSQPSPMQQPLQNNTSVSSDRQTAEQMPMLGAINLTQEMEHALNRAFAAAKAAVEATNSSAPATTPAVVSAATTRASVAASIDPPHASGALLVTGVSGVVPRAVPSSSSIALFPMSSQLSQIPEVLEALSFPPLHMQTSLAASSQGLVAST